ncbi:MAG: cupin domain-containing protein [Porcipelethomonas sp.]
MIIEFEKIEETVIPNFKGGEKEFSAKIYADENNRIMRGRLQPGASIGMHTHDINSEIIFIISGNGKVLIDDGEERLPAGSCHYCPMGHSHSLINDGNDTLEFYCVVPQHRI